MATVQTYNKAYLDVRLVTAPQRTITASATLVLTDAGFVVEVNSAGAATVTVPPNAFVGFLIGTVIEVYAMGAGAVTIAPGAGVTVRRAGQIATRYSTVSLRKRATDEWVLSGEIV